jgi:hypothetical protein
VLLNLVKSLGRSIRTHSLSLLLMDVLVSCECGALKKAVRANTDNRNSSTYKCA